MLELCGFNPRARDGREELGEIKAEDIPVSIHAPVMDANSWQVIRRVLLMFQSTRP